MTRPPRPWLILALAGLVCLASSPALAQEAQQLVSESLWGVQENVGIGAVQQFITNYGERGFWQARPSGEGVRVAVIDTGLDPSHPDLQDVLACGHCWRDLVANRAQPYDDHGHGTHVAGILAGRGHLQLNPLS
ncbi:MAG: S8 family serine peptidase, partial [Candidatus Thermoplasmatota archaeon]|nr:S8 family serine peptidase [Candidatus Thermoplasmatota archaeon]